MQPPFRNFTIFLVLLASFGCETARNPSLDAREYLRSPNEQLRIEFFLDALQQPAYRVEYGQQVVLDTSLLGFSLKDAPPLSQGFTLVRTTHQEKDYTWETVWGERRQIRDNYRELLLELAEKNFPFRQMHLRFRAYDDGMAFRYEFPEQSKLDEVVIMSEETQFRFLQDHRCWWIPANFDSYEYLYTESRLSEIDNNRYDHSRAVAQTLPYRRAAHTPLTMQVREDLFVSIHEANLTDYASMALEVDSSAPVLKAALAPAADGSCVRVQTPFVSPWRTMQLSETAGGLIESSLILNLNEPSTLEDVSWIQPMKYIGIWWGMHIGKYTWHMGPNHGATTENTRRYIDFAAAHGIRGVLTEGWNPDWERKSPMNFTTPYPDFALRELAEYAKEKGVSLISHNETFADVSNYEKQLDTAMAFLENAGISAVKTGYVGPIIPKGECHQGQWMVKHYDRVVKRAASSRIMVDVHEPVKPTGLRRTYPNMMTREGARGQEWNAFSEGNPANHSTILPFTRMLAGPMDYTPGIFDLMIKGKAGNRVPTTLAHQLALFVVLYSPLQMAADLPENYEGQPAFRFIEEVAVDWEESHVLNGEIGRYVTIVRKDRHSDKWFLGAVTNGDSREITLSLDFLDPDRKYEAHIYQDAAEADWETNPTAIQIRKKTVQKGEKLTIRLAPGGGLAISFFPAK